MFLYGNWLKLPINVRLSIAKEFGILKKGSTHVVDNQIQSDGFLVHEVEAGLDKGRIRNFLQTDEKDHDILWNMLIDKVNGKVAPAPALTILPPAEAKQFKREYKKRQKDANTNQNK